MNEADRKAADIWFHLCRMAPCCDVILQKVRSGAEHERGMSYKFTLRQSGSDYAKLMTQDTVTLSYVDAEGLAKYIVDSYRGARIDEPA